MSLRSMIVACLLALSAVNCFGQPTVSKPSNIELTVYNQGFGLVKEERRMNLDEGINMVPVQDVAATIEASSIAFKSKTDPNSVVVREQNYRYDLINPGTILDKSIGKRVKVRRLVNGAVQEDEGVLLSELSTTAVGAMRPEMSNEENEIVSRNFGIVIQTDHGLLLNPKGEIEVMELPEGLVSRPTLVWKLESTKAGPQTTEISYLANVMGWSADYVAVVDPSDKFVDLTGWVTLTNGSGMNYDNATLNLVAGDVHRVPTADYKFKVVYSDQADAREASPAPQFAEKRFFEYHLYTLQNKTSVRDKETKQITLLTANRIPAKKLFIYDARRDWWNQYGGNADYRPGQSYDVNANKKINVVMEVVNSKQNNLGIPLPKGKIRMYKSEAGTNQHFIGEDTIDHTPKDETLRLYMGDAFDIVGEHTRTSFRRISAKEVEESFAVTLRNHKDTPVTVTVVDHLFGDWRVTSGSHKYNKKDASTIEFPVQVPKSGEVKVTYTVRTR